MNAWPLLAFLVPIFFVLALAGCGGGGTRLLVSNPNCVFFCESHTTQVNTEDTQPINRKDKQP